MPTSNPEIGDFMEFDMVGDSSDGRTWEGVNNEGSNFPEPSPVRLIFNS